MGFPDVDGISDGVVIIGEWVREGPIILGDVDGYEVLVEVEGAHDGDS